MANKGDLRRRIRSVKSTQQITKAMKMVAAARLRRAQQRILEARPYAAALSGVLRSLAAQVNPRRHPLLAERPEKTATIIAVTGDKGLCGAFNTNIVRLARQKIEELEASGKKVLILAVGRKGRDAMRRARVPIEAHFAGFGDKRLAAGKHDDLWARAVAVRPSGRPAIAPSSAPQPQAAEPFYRLEP